MKSIKTICLLLLSITLVITKNLKSKDDEFKIASPPKIQKSVDPKTVKSLGEFSNISPDATQIIQPKYANPHLQVIMNIEKYNEPVQKLEWHGTSVAPTKGFHGDLAGIKSGRQGYTDYLGHGQTNKMIMTMTTENMKTTTIHPVMLDLNNNQAKWVPEPNKYTDPKKTFGTNN